MGTARTCLYWGCLVLAAGATGACSAEPASGGSNSFGGALGAVVSGGASNDAEGSGVAGVEVSASATGGGAGTAVRGSAEIGASGAGQASPGTVGQASAGAGLTGSADACDLDAFARDFTVALAESTAPSGCAMPIARAPVGKGEPVSAAALDFVASTYGESPGAFTFTLESCGTPSTATCVNLFDKYAGSGPGGNLWILGRLFSETIERCSAGIELSVWTMTNSITSSTFFCLIGDRGGQAMGYCVFDRAGC
jgi:hypothetical protein